MTPVTGGSAAAAEVRAADRTQTLGMVSLLVVLVTWSFGPPLSSRVTTHPLVSASFRMTVAAVLQWILVAVMGKLPSWALLRRSLVPGALFCLNNILFFAALRNASVANTTLLVSLQPVVVMFLAKPLFGEVVRLWDVAWTAVALAGVAFAIIGANAGHPAKRTTWLGACFAIASMLAFCGYFLLAKRENSAADRQPPHPLTYMTAIVTGSAITSWPFLILGGRVGEAVHINRTQVSALMLVVLVPTIGHLFMTYAHRHIDASVSALVLLSQPVTTGLAAWWMLGQRVVLAQVIGGAVVVVSIAMVTLRRRRLAGIATAERLLVAESVSTG